MQVPERKIQVGVGGGSTGGEAGRGEGDRDWLAQPRQVQDLTARHKCTGRREPDAPARVKRWTERWQRPGPEGEEREQRGRDAGRGDGSDQAPDAGRQLRASLRGSVLVFWRGRARSSTR